MIFLQTKMVLFSKIAEKEKDGGAGLPLSPPSLYLTWSGDKRHTDRLTEAPAV